MSWILKDDLTKQRQSHSGNAMCKAVGKKAQGMNGGRSLGAAERELLGRGPTGCKGGPGRGRAAVSV